MNLLFVSPSGLDTEFYVSMLLDGGFRAHVADSIDAATDALAAGTDTSLDVIIVDLLPQPQKAWEFVGHMIASPSRVPLIILTALVRPDGANRRRARELGCAAFVAKPCSPAQLVSIVRRVVDGERGLETTDYDPA